MNGSDIPLELLQRLGHKLPVPALYPNWPQGRATKGSMLKKAESVGPGQLLIDVFVELAKSAEAIDGATDLGLVGVYHLARPDTNPTDGAAAPDSVVTVCLRDPVHWASVEALVRNGPYRYGLKEVYGVSRAAATKSTEVSERTRRNLRVARSSFEPLTHDIPIIESWIGGFLRESAKRSVSEGSAQAGA